MSTKQQVIIVGGGETFDTREDYLSWLENQMTFEPFRYATRKKNWKENLQADLNGWFGSKYEVAYLSMPNKLDAKYDAWKIYFDRIIPHLRDGVILVGHSLGGLFLSKYLGESKDFPVKVSAVCLISTPLSCYSSSTGRGFNNEGFGGFSIELERYCQSDCDFGECHVFHSVDDTVVPLKDSVYQNCTNFTPHTFSDRGHFIHDEHFPELVSVIKQVSSPKRR